MSSRPPLRWTVGRILIPALLLLFLPGGRGFAGDDGIRFEGNESIDESSLRDAASEELLDFQRQGYRKADIDDAAWQMEELYRKEGYAFAEVRYTFEKAEAAPEVAFFFEEGPRVLLGNVTLTGNEAVGTEELEVFFIAGSGDVSDSKTSFVRRDFEEAAGSLRDFYYGRGFVEAKVEPPLIAFAEDRSRADVTISVREGPLHVIRKVILRMTTWLNFVLPG